MISHPPHHDAPYSHQPHSPRVQDALKAVNEQLIRSAASASADNAADEERVRRLAEVTLVQEVVCMLEFARPTPKKPPRPALPHPSLPKNSKL